MDLDVQAMVQLVHLQVQRPPDKLRGGLKASRRACRKVVQTSMRGRRLSEVQVDKQTELINQILARFYG